MLYFERLNDATKYESYKHLDRQREKEDRGKMLSHFSSRLVVLFV